MARRRFYIDDIIILDGRRAPDDNKVSALADSIRDVGLMNPPAVRIKDGVTMPDGEVSDATPVLIVGRHRLLALKSLGHEYAECEVYDVDDLHAELMEIDENLARAELSPAQEAAHIQRRAEIWEELNGVKTGGKNCPTSLSDGRGSGPQHQKQFAAEVSELTGGTKRDINRKIARAAELGPDINRIAGTSLDKGVEMDALIKLPEPERKSLIERAAAGEKVTARPVPTKPAESTVKAVFRHGTPEERLAVQVIDAFGPKGAVDFMMALHAADIADLETAVRRLVA